MINRNPNIWAALLLLAMHGGCGPGNTQTASTEQTVSLDAETEQAVDDATNQSDGDFYTVSSYDESRDPSDDLAATVARAKAEEKRVILQIGGDWCGWCSRITDFMSTNTKVRSHLEKNFLVMKVTYPGEYAEDFLSTYPKCEAYPHFFVLDGNAELLVSQGTGELEKGDGYDEDVFMAFLTKWGPSS